jgi:membrane-bound lytic murein transglycosylase D
MTANNLRKEDYIKAGQQLRIPMKGAGLAYERASETTGYTSVQPIRYRVKRGDSLWLLARRHNTNISEIMDLNNLKSRRLYVDQELIIPQGSQGADSGGRTKTYQVKTGDSPYGIAMGHEMKLERFLSLNDLTPRSKIYPGQKFLVDAK